MFRKMSKTHKMQTNKQGTQTINLNMKTSIGEMKTREQAEKRALELYPDTYISLVNQLHEVSRQAYLKGWEEAQDTKLRESAEKVVEYWKMNPSLVDDWERDMDISVEELEKELK